MRLRLAGATVAAALLAPSAAAADVTIQAVDGVAANGSDNRWAPPYVEVQPGETVTWSFAGTTLAHNVASAGPNWSYAVTPAVAGPPGTYAFTAPGYYDFVCELHKTPMRGTIKVGAPPPPPPPPLSEQPWTNDAPAPAALEVRDTVAPRLDRVRVTRVRRGARVRFRLSEAGQVAVRLTRRGRTAKRRIVDVRKGTSSVTLRGLHAGTYRVEVRASDLAGNAAKRPQRARVAVRS